MRKGNVSVLCNSNLYLGPDWKFSLLLPGLLVSFVVMFFFTNDAPDSMAKTLVVMAFSCVVLLAYSRAAFTNPGIIEPGDCTSAEPASEGEAVRLPSRWVRVLNRRTIPANFEEAYFMVEQRWCYTCRIYRPLRSVHCRFCNVCLHRRDHHCPWLGICVAANNLASFFVLLCSLTLFSVILCLFSVLNLSRRAKELSSLCELESPPNSSLEGRKHHISLDCSKSIFFQAVLDTFGLELFLILAPLIVLGFVGAQVGQQCFLIMRNETMGDALHFSGANPYDKGSFWKNARASFCFNPSEFENCDIVERTTVDADSTANPVERTGGTITLRDDSSEKVPLSVVVAALHGS